MVTRQVADKMVEITASAPNSTEPTAIVQKMYSENVLHARHDVWDVHTDVDRRR
ncbi:MAG TPA: hypothetical protein VK595_17755 [Vicinamibacterales bacterium]|nr:hypothetical protein [Vicinamibacterales bacterium]